MVIFKGLNLRFCITGKWLHIHATLYDLQIQFYMIMIFQLRINSHSEFN